MSSAYHVLHRSLVKGVTSQDTELSGLDFTVYERLGTAA